MRWPCPPTMIALLLAAILMVPPGLALSMGPPEAATSPANAHDAPEPGHIVTSQDTGHIVTSQDTGRIVTVQDAGHIVTSQGPGRIVLAPAVPWVQMSEHMQLTFECPQGNSDTLLGQTDPNVNVVRARCPFRIIDEADLLGSPQLAVRHDDPREVAFFSLHGGATGNGPTPRSRDPDGGPASGLSHTAFTSPDRGWNWKDNPYGTEGFGETNAGIMTRDGNMVVASLFSRALGRDGSGQQIFDYHFQLYKENTAKDPSRNNGFKIQAREPGNVIDEVNLVLVTPARVIETDEQYQEYLNRTEEDNGTRAPSDDDDVGNYTISQEEEDYSDDIIVAAWHEQALDWRNATTGRSSWIDFVWTDASSRNQWKKIDDAQLVGPCRDASNPVAWNGQVYVACVVDAGYEGRRGARIGDVDLWAIDPVAGTKTFMSMVPGASDGRPRLAATPDGRFALSLSKLEEMGPTTRPEVWLHFGWYGREWGAAQNIGIQLESEIGAAKLRDARVTAMVMLEDTHTVYLSFMERLNGTLNLEPSFNPNDPRMPASVEYRKIVGTWEDCHWGPLALYDLQVGVARHPFQEGLINDFTGVFDDLHDGMQVVRDPRTGEEHVYFAYGDHGVIQYGIIHGKSGGGICPVPIPPVLFTPVPPVPTPLLLSSGVGVGTASAVGSVAALGLGSLLLAKRRVAMAVAAKAK